jgi:hypothetical protein
MTEEEPEPRLTEILVRLIKSLMRVVVSPVTGIISSVICSVVGHKYEKLTYGTGGISGALRGRRVRYECRRCNAYPRNQTEKQAARANAERENEGDGEDREETKVGEDLDDGDDALKMAGKANK